MEVTETSAAALQGELAETRRRLAEAEATLEAIRRGDVDALVVQHRGGQEEIRSILNMGSLANSLFNQVAQPTFILDRTNRIQRCNQAARDLVGGEPEGREFLEVLPLMVEAQDGNESAFRLNGWIESKRHIEALDVNFDHPALGTRFYLLDANPVDLGWDGEPGGILTLLDITARKLAEIQLLVRGGQLRHQVDILKSITDNIPEGLLLLDEDDRVIFHNPAALTILEHSGDEMLGQDLDAVFRPRAEGGGKDLLPVASGLAGDHVGRGMLAGKDGRSVPVQYVFHPLKARLESSGSVLVISDISAQKAAEEALVQSLEKQQHSQKMEAIGRLAGGIAHDFNNLLLAILGFTDLSILQAGEDSPLHENLREVRRAGERAAALTAQLLAYSRKQMLDPRVHDLNAVVHDLQKMLGRIIGENIRLRVDLAQERLPARVDQSKLQQVLVNMTLNARDAMSGGGVLTLRTGSMRSARTDRTGLVRETKRESGDGVPPGDFGFVEIEDTGHGMEQEVLDHLFEPFFTTKEFGKGSGLGLSTAYGIVRQMGGYVQVYSLPGKGTRFKVVFPKTAVPEARPEEPSPRGLPQATGTGEGILLVEDEDVVRKLLKKLLVDHGYRVIEASDGAEALRKLPGKGEAPISLVVTDMIMDGMGGLELAENLARLRPGLGILFISGYAEDQHKLPMDGPERPFFAAKPFRPAEFLELVRRILERKARA